MPGLLRGNEESASTETQPSATQANGAVAPTGEGRPPAVTRAGAGSAPAFRIVDQYVLRSFLLYLAVLVASFVMIWFVFSFFELLNDMLAREKMDLFVALHVLFDTVSDLQNDAAQRTGRDFSLLRHSCEAQRADGVQSLRHQPFTVWRPRFSLRPS